MVRVVIGTTIKPCKISELNLPHNVRFFERLFTDYKVFAIEGVSEVTKESFDAFIDERSSTDAEEPIEEDEEPEEEAPKAPAKHDNLRRKAAARRQTSVQSDQETSLPLYRSTAATHIIVDDLPVGEGVRGENVKRMLSIAPNKAVNLATLDPEAVKRSVILRQLIRDGILVPCTPSEASEMDAETEARTLREERLRTDSVSPIIADDKPGSALRYAESMRSNASGTNYRTMLQDDPETIEISGDEPSPRYRESEQLSLNDLMRLAGAHDDGPPIEDPGVQPLPRQRRQLDQRGTVDKDGRPTRRLRKL